MGRLKIREWKMRYRQNCKGRKCSRQQRLKMQEWKKQEYIAGVENAGVNRMEQQPEIILRKPQVTSLDLSLFFWLNKVRLVRTAQTAQTVSPYIEGCGVGVPLSLGSYPESESDSEFASKSRTPTPETRPVSSVVLDTNGRPIDRLLIKNVENFYFPFDGFSYTVRYRSCIFHSCIFHSCIFHHCCLLHFLPLQFCLYRIFHSRIFSRPIISAVSYTHLTLPTILRV